MTAPALSFQSIEVRRMPGFPTGGLELAELCPGINIVYGPNASGKTTLGRAIHRLLNPTAVPQGRDSLRAHIVLNERPISIDYDFGHIGCQSLADGSDIDCPKLAPTEIGNRYVLALHDLVNAEREHDLAQEIAREFAGGYDVSGAAGELNFKEKPAGKGKLSKEHDAAKRHYRGALAKQDWLLGQQETLAQSQTEKQAALDAATRLEWLKKAGEYLDALEDYEQAERQISDYPEGIGKITGQEIKEIDRLKSSIKTKQDQRAEEQQKLKEALNSLAKCKLPDGGVSVELISSLRLKSKRLGELRDEVRRAEKERAESEEELNAVKEQLGSDFTVEKPADLDTQTVNDLFSFVRHAESLRLERETARSVSDWLNVEESTVEPESMRDAINRLQIWLVATDSATQSDRRNFLGKVIAGTATCVIALGMGFVVHPSWYGLLLVGTGLLGWAFWPKAESVRSRDIQREYLNHQVGEPASWSVDDVRTQIQELQRRHDRASLDRERRLKWGDLQAKREQLSQRQVELDKQRQEWIDRLGVNFDEATLAVLAANIIRLHKAQQELAASQSAIETARSEFQELRDSLFQVLQSFDVDTVDDPEVIAAQVESLAERQHSYSSAAQEIKSCRENLSRIQNDLNDQEAELRALFEGVGLPPDEENTLRHWTDQKPGYDDAINQKRIAAATRESVKKTISEHPELLELSREELLAEQRHCRDRSDQLTTISEKIGGIEQAIETARQGSDLGNALAKVMAAADELREQRDGDCDAVLGNVLVQFINRQERDTELPVILRRASELFARITHGRYELRVQTSDQPEFRAIDSSNQTGLSLDQLSSGTRLQLLLAVRVAFVERQEQGLKVPLILDETLGNSDERRAQEIIDAAIEICKDGRQIFYFTAQPDEVAKWRQQLKDPDAVEFRIVDLAEERKFDETERLPIAEYERPKPVEIPAPDGRDWLAYGELLKIPRLRPDGDTANCHLWYLIDDLPTLYRLLKNGINKWGQLQTLVSINRVEGISTDSDILQKARAKARMIEVLLRHWNVGRGRPVDRGALMESGAVSETFLDRLAELATQLNGDGKSIIRALDSGMVKGFRNDKRNDLESYLTDRGYIDERDVLTAEQIREKVRLEVFGDLEKSLIDQQQFEVLVELVAHVENW